VLDQVDPLAGLTEHEKALIRTEFSRSTKEKFKAPLALKRTIGC